MKLKMVTVNAPNANGSGNAKLKFLTPSVNLSATSQLLEFFANILVTKEQIC